MTHTKQKCCLVVNSLIRETVSIKHGLRPADGGLPTADYGLGIQRGLSIKCRLSLKIAVLTHKSQTMLLYQFSLALLSWVYFIYSISFSNLRFGFENSENYFRIRQQQGTLNLKEGDKVYTKFFFLQGG